MSKRWLRRQAPPKDKSLAPEVVAALTKRAMRACIEVRHSKCQSGATLFSHVMFDVDGERVADYYPTKGRIHVRGELGIADSPDDALDMVLDVLRADVHSRAPVESYTLFGDSEE